MTDNMSNGGGEETLRLNERVHLLEELQRMALGGEGSKSPGRSTVPESNGPSAADLLQDSAPLRAQAQGDAPVSKRVETVQLRDDGLPRAAPIYVTLDQYATAAAASMETSEDVSQVAASGTDGKPRPRRTLFDYNSETEADVSEWDGGGALRAFETSHNPTASRANRRNELIRRLEARDAKVMRRGGRRDRQDIAGLREAFRCTPILTRKRVLRPSVNVKQGTRLQTIVKNVGKNLSLEALPHDAPWMGHVYEGNVRVGQIDELDVVCYVASLMTEGQDVAHVVAEHLRSDTAAMVLETTTQVPRFVAVSYEDNLLEAAEHMSSTGRYCASVLTRHIEEEVVPTLGLPTLMGYLNAMLKHFPRLGRRRLNELPLFSDKLALLPATTATGEAFKVMAQGRHARVGILNEASELVAELRPIHVQHVRADTASSLNLSVGDYLAKHVAPESARPSWLGQGTSLAEAVRSMAVAGTHGAWIVASGESPEAAAAAKPLGLVDGLNVLRYCIMYEEKSHLAATWRSRALAQEAAEAAPLLPEDRDGLSKDDPRSRLWFEHAPIKEGALLLLSRRARRIKGAGSKQRHWKPRFFRLVQHHLLFCPQQGEKDKLSALECIPLQDCTVSKRGETRFLVKCATTSWLVRAPSPEVRDEWLRLVRKQTFIRQ